MVTPGALGFLVYMYAFYAFEVRVTALTPLHVAIIGLAFWSMFAVVPALGSDSADASFATRLPRRTTGVVSLVIAALFGFQWIGQMAGVIRSGQMPADLVDLNVATKSAGPWTWPCPTYPSTTKTQAVHLDIDYPDASKDLNRWMPLVKWLLAIPHYVILAILWLFAFVAIVVAWFAILITGRYPRGLFNFVVGLFRWSLRVSAYMYLLVTDQYPPFGMG